MKNQRLRIIHDGAHDGATNMARDEALLTLVGEGGSAPTLRTYQWSPPIISLGYFQKHADYAKLAPPAGDLPVVRRQTGGGAILHDRELTYSLVFPLDHPLLADGPNVLYETAHDALMECLEQRGVPTQRQDKTDESGPAKGPFFCFARRHRLDILIGDDKLAGSAQRRTRKAVLQHGSIMFERRYTQQPAAAVRNVAALEPDHLRRPFADAFTRRTDLRAVPGQWTEVELALAADLTSKYAGDAWTRRT